MNQEDLLVLLVVFVLGFAISQMMSGRLVEGDEGNPAPNLMVMACLKPNGHEVEFPCDISDDSDNKLVTINMNTGDKVDQTEVMRNEKCNNLFYEKNNVRYDEANRCLQCVVDNKTKCCNKGGDCPLNLTYVPGFNPRPDDCCNIKNENDCNSDYLDNICKWHPGTGQCRNISLKLFSNDTLEYYPCPPSK